VKDTVRPVDVSPGPGYAGVTLADCEGVNCPEKYFSSVSGLEVFPMRTAHQVARAFAELTPPDPTGKHTASSSTREPRFPLPPWSCILRPPCYWNAADCLLT
jgi:hypothetical protein